MSTATAFKYYRPFPVCFLSSSPGSAYDYVDVTLEEAMAIWWNLEAVSVTTSGTSLDGDIGWTSTFGPTESLAFTPSGSVNRDGPYYNGTTPARQPNTKVCYNSAQALLILSYQTSLNSWSMDFRLRLNPSLSGYRIYYRILIRSTGPTLGGVVQIENPALGSAGGTAPSSGTFSLLGVSFNWRGGGVTGSTYNSDTASISVSSSAFTY